jgi:formylmethanofuran dehydrogenase subunit C
MTERQPVVLSVPEVRDYARINSQVLRWLDSGRTRIELAGVAKQRLLLAGLVGSWEARIDVQGDAGPELAAGMNAPNLIVTCLGSAADAAGRELAGGTLRILGNAADCVGYRQRGGSIFVAGSAGHRAGLEMSGGLIVVLGDSGRLCGHGQHGGRLIVRGTTGPFPGFARDGGGFFPGPNSPEFSEEERRAIEELQRLDTGLLPAGFGSPEPK